MISEQRFGRGDDGYFAYTSDKYGGEFNSEAEARAFEEASDAAAKPAAKAPIENKVKAPDVDALTRQILGQGTSGKWTGEGFGGAEQNAREMAKMLADIGITDINQFGKIKSVASDAGQAPSAVYPNDPNDPSKGYYTFEHIKKEGAGEDGGVGIVQTDKKIPVDPNSIKKTPIIDWENGGIETGQYNLETTTPVYEETFGNKVTNQRFDDPNKYGYRGGDIFSGTYSGKDQTQFGVKFAADGTPRFYTQAGASTSSMGDIAPIISVLSVIPSPLQPFAAAANSLIALDNGNVLGALASFAGIPGVSEAMNTAGLANVVSGMQTANKVVNLVNAIESGNLIGALSEGAGLAGVKLPGGNIGSTQIGDTGFTYSDAMKAAGLVKAIGSEDPTAIFKAVQSFASSPSIQKSLDNKTTTLGADGQKVADVNVQDFVAELKNPESSNFLGDTDTKLQEVTSQAGTQLASTDDKTAIQAIQDLIDSGAATLGAPKSVDEMLREIPTDEASVDQGELLSQIGDQQQLDETAKTELSPEDAEMTVIPGEDGIQIVIDGNGNVVDMIPAGQEPSQALTETDINTTADGVPNRLDVQPVVLDAEENRVVLDAEAKPDAAKEVKTEGSDLTVIPGENGTQLVLDADGNVVDMIPAESDQLQAAGESEVAQATDKTADLEAKDTDEAKTSTGPMGPKTEDQIQREKDEFGRYLDYMRDGEPEPPKYGVQDLGITDENFKSFDENLKKMIDDGNLPTQWKPGGDGTYTLTGDDGDTLTIGSDGSILGSTDAPKGNLLSDTVTTTPPVTTKPITLPNINTGNKTLKTGNDTLKKAATVGAVVAGGAAIKDALTGDNQPVQQPAPPTMLKMDWNQAQIQAPKKGIAFGQQYLNPVFSPVTAAQGGLMSLAGGGMLGSYSDGGRLLRGPGDGMSDNIPASIAGKRPARLADGEFVIPADVVSHLGNGSTQAGSKVLYQMMERIRKARTGNPKQGKQINPSKFIPK